MGDRTATTTEVEIFGAVYTVRGEQDGEYLRRLAATVDERMREIAEHVSTVDTARIAILAALNLTDELFQCQRGQEGPGGEIEKRIERLADTLASALATRGSRGPVTARA